MSGLSLPTATDDYTPEQLLNSDAVQLFVARARAVLPTFQLNAAVATDVSCICRMLDGLPLAIELAAARLRIMSVGELAERLTRDYHLLGGAYPAAHPRQQTIEALFDWSYRLLTPAEQQLFRLLGVFHGGFHLAAVEAVAQAASLHGVETMDILTHLVDKSLVVRAAEAGAGLHLLETVREYAARQMSDVERRLAERYHCEYYVSFPSRRPMLTRNPSTTTSGRSSSALVNIPHKAGAIVTIIAMHMDAWDNALDKAAPLRINIVRTQRCAPACHA